MVRELGVDAAEARIKEAAQVIAPKTDTVNKTDIRFFIRKSLVLEHEFAVIAYGDALWGQWAFSAKGERLSAAWSAIGRQDLRGWRAQVHAIDRQPTRRGKHRTRERKTFRDIVGDKKGVSAPRVIGSCLVRAHDRRKSGSPERVAMRGP